MPQTFQLALPFDTWSQCEAAFTAIEKEAAVMRWNCYPPSFPGHVCCIKEHNHCPPYPQGLGPEECGGN
jgi:hypothetical protein